MAYNKVFFEHPQTGARKVAPVGFSWTTFFFGFWVPLFRGDWKWFVFMFLLALFTLGIALIYFWFAYNKLHIKGLVDAGYKVTGVESGTVDVIASAIGLSLPLFEKK